MAHEIHGQIGLPIGYRSGNQMLRITRCLDVTEELCIDPNTTVILTYAFSGNKHIIKVLVEDPKKPTSCIYTSIKDPTDFELKTLCKWLNLRSHELFQLFQKCLPTIH